jgi:hypothetical protein
VQGLPTHIARAREPVLASVLSHLPDEMLSALAYGLERHAGRLQAGHLYADYDGGGCAVGVMLRELSPSVYQEGRLRFWARRRRHASVLTEHVSLERSLVTRLSHVEMCFDRTAMTLCEQVEEGDKATAANATGRWMAEQCREELRARSRAGHVGFFVPEDWQAPKPRRQRAAARQQLALPAALPAMTRLRRMTAHDGTQTLVSVPARRRGAQPASATRERRVRTHHGSEVRVALGAGAVLRPLEPVPPVVRADAEAAAGSSATSCNRQTLEIRRGYVAGWDLSGGLWCVGGGARIERDGDLGGVDGDVAAAARFDELHLRGDLGLLGELGLGGVDRLQAPGERVRACRAAALA